MKYLLIGIVVLFIQGCELNNGKPYYTICDDGGCADVLIYTNDNGCLTYKSSLGKGQYKTSCGDVRIYYENGARPIKGN